MSARPKPVTDVLKAGDRGAAHRGRRSELLPEQRALVDEGDVGSSAASLLGDLPAGVATALSQVGGATDAERLRARLGLRRLGVHAARNSDAARQVAHVRGVEKRALGVGEEGEVLKLKR